jgi:hypothetical protein
MDKSHTNPGRQWVVAKQPLASWSRTQGHVIRNLLYCQWTAMLLPALIERYCSCQRHSRRHTTHSPVAEVQQTLEVHSSKPASVCRYPRAISCCHLADLSRHQEDCRLCQGGRENESGISRVAAVPTTRSMVTEDTIAQNG